MKVSDEQIIEVASRVRTMSEGANILGLRLSTFARRAKILGVYQPNQARRGISRESYENANKRIPLEEIIDGKHPQYGTNHLKKRLIKEGFIEDKCQICGDCNPAYARILDHINGVNNDHTLDNLRLVCPNCNASLPTHAGKNKKQSATFLSDENLVRDILSSKTNREILLSMGMCANGANYKRINRIRVIIEICLQYARVVESADTKGSNPFAARHVSSSLTSSTTKCQCSTNGSAAHS